MGDVGEDFALLKALNKARRAKNYDRALVIQPIFTVHTQWHWSIMVNGKKLDYWPSSSRWHYDGKSFNGTPENLMKFMMNRNKGKLPGVVDVQD
jgi:hypothetical protein